MIELVKEEYNMRTDDIQGTHPNVMKDTIRTKRVTNPLDPQYVLSNVEQRPPTPPKFLRDNINIKVEYYVVNKYRILMEQSLKNKLFMPLEILWIIKILKEHMQKNSKNEIPSTIILIIQI